MYKVPDDFGRTATVTASSWASGKTAKTINANASLIIQALPVAGANTIAAVNPATGTQATLLWLGASTDGATISSSATSMESIVVGEH